mgnify:CR=1 FL=1
MIRDNRPRFNEVIVAFHETNQGEDYREFVKQAMFSDYIHFVQPPVPVGIEDWRNVSVNASLLHSYNAPWVMFTEQDFYPSYGFWENVEELENGGCEVIAAYQGPRMHPCCIFVKREVLNKTSKNFGIVPDKLDHFGLFQKEILELGVKVGKVDDNKYHHLNGLSHNWSLASQGQQPNYEVAEFITWLIKCLELGVPIDQRFVGVAMRILEANCPPEVVRSISKAIK